MFLHPGFSNLSASLCSSAFTAAQVSVHHASHAATVLTECPQTHHRMGGRAGEEGEGAESMAGVLSPVVAVIVGAKGPSKQKRLQSCEEIRAKDGASFAVWPEDI